MRILSIDFDYFLDTNIEVRNNQFPDGEDFKPLEELNKDWEEVYELFPDILNMDLIKDFDYICDFLRNNKTGKVIYHDSHSEIGKLFPLIPDNEELELINIDFHHDNYVSGKDLDCANWMRFLSEQRENMPTKIKWVKRSDSQTVSMIGEFPYEMTEDISEVKGEFDYIFICFSPEWTPPHLRNRYLEMIEVANNDR